MAILNNSPVLSLSDIIIQLFNNELLADISFACDNKVIYAHSFLLMSRSVVYEKELNGNQGRALKLIPIQNYDYETFYQFVRFIYTDACTITKQNLVPLLELSVKYKIPKLENMVIAFIMRDEDNQLTFMEKFRVYEFCTEKNYELLLNWITPFISPLIQDIIKSKHFVETKPHTLEAILKMDYMGTKSKPVQEVDLFKALLEWMNYYCTKNRLPLSERRVNFDWLINLIRFPNMIFNEFIDCAQKSNNLFTDSDFLKFFKPEPGIMCKYEARQLSNDGFKNPSSKSVDETVEYYDDYNRFMFGKMRYEHMNYNNDRPMTKPKRVRTLVSQNTKRFQIFETTENLIISGLRIKSSNINGIHVKSGSSELLNMQLTPSSSSEVIVSLGESYVLRIGNEHQIEISNTFKSSDTMDTKIDLVNEKFIKCYKEIVRDNRLVEIFFKFPVHM